MRKRRYMIVITMAMLLVVSGSNLFTAPDPGVKECKSGCNLDAGECFADCDYDFDDCLEDCRTQKAGGDCKKACRSVLGACKKGCRFEKSECSSACREDQSPSGF